MERSEILTAMAELKLYGMKAAFDEIITTGVKRQHEPHHAVGDLLTADITEKQSRSIRYQITIAKLPLAKEIDEFTFDDTLRFVLALHRGSDDLVECCLHAVELQRSISGPS